MSVEQLSNDYGNELLARCDEHGLTVYPQKGAALNEGLLKGFAHVVPEDACSKCRRARLKAQSKAVSDAR